ncbi:unannotated protein [freshwater metagenome]|uniref:Unannotated protein n=1 Tax=freshwater metagenome TaxID=449393 RepID=A0A6J5YWH4_9ZZZZ
MPLSIAGDDAEKSASTLLGRTVITAVPCETLDLTVVDPPKTDCVAVRSAATSIASVMIPESVSTETRAATSLPKACDAIRTAVGDFSLTRFASASADAATP